MPLSSRWSPPVPSCSLQQWVFGSCFDPLPEKDAYIDADRPTSHRLSFPALRLLSKRLGLGLARAGLVEGDRVLVFAGNSVVYPAVFLGILMAGGVFTGAPPAFAARELAYQLDDSGAKFMLASPDVMDVALGVAGSVGLPTTHVILLDSTMPGSNRTESTAADGARHWTELLAPESEAAGWQWVEPRDPADALCCLNYSSGTTGLPKGVETTHRNYVANSVGVVSISQIRPDFDAVVAGSVELCILPMYHVFSQTHYAVVLPHQRTTTYVMSRFDLPRMLAHVQAFAVTQLVLVPPIVTALVKAPVVRSFDLGSLQIIRCGAAPLSIDIARAVGGLSPRGVTVRQGWGMTEVTCTALSWAWDNMVPDLRSVGELAPNCRAKLVDLADGESEITELRTPGELWVSGPTLMRAYRNNPEATRNAVSVDDDGTRWLRTGDVAYVDGARGFAPGAVFYVVDRIKELIKVRGRQVAPAELEALLLERADVMDTAVVGVVVDGEELPRAYVVRSPAAAAAGVHGGDDGAAEQEVQAWVAERVAKYKRLAGGVAFVDAIPKTPSGKVLRGVLRQLAQREASDKEPRDSRLA